jgi:hypothetical protein
MAELELKPEHAEDPNTRRVGIVGILLSVVTIASHRSHTNAVMLRTESNDAWAFYQAKKIRESTSDVGITVLQALSTDPAKIEASVHKLEQARDKYASDAKEQQQDATAKDTETVTEERRALRFDIGEGLLELGLVLCSLYFLARKPFFPIFGLIASAAGAALGIVGFLL